MVKAPSTGPRRIRVLIFALSLLLFFFYTWLLLFIVNDIDRLPGPDWNSIQARHVGQGQIDRQAELARQRDATVAQIEQERETQQLLQQSTASSQATLGQLINLHRASVDKGVNLGEQEQAAFVESEKLFLSNQEKYQEANERIAQLTQRRRELENESQELQAKMNEASRPAQEQWARESVRNGYQRAALKLSFLVPVLLLAAWLTIRQAGSVYRPIVFPLLPATLLLTGMVMHEHFPSELFKYIAIVAGIIVLVLILVRLIRVVVAPRGEWLMSRYREAYQDRRCPICSQAIRQVESRALVVGSRGIVELADGDGPTEACSCAVCGTRLYEKCDKCGHLRHSLLPYCERCGDQHTAETAAPATAAH